MDLLMALWSQDSTLIHPSCAGVFQVAEVMQPDGAAKSALNKVLHSGWDMRHSLHFSFTESENLLLEGTLTYNLAQAHFFKHIKYCLHSPKKTMA